MKNSGVALILLGSLCGGMAIAAEPFPDNMPALDAGSLDNARGADSELIMVSSQQDFAAGVEDASFTAGTMTTGAVNLAEGAFSGFRGVGVNVLNTGNANAFSTGVSMSVNLH